MPLQDFQEPWTEQSLVVIISKVQTIPFMKPEGGYVNVEEEHSLFMSMFIHRKEIVFGCFLA